jgi:acyl-CoA carboxylase subunit beta
MSILKTQINRASFGFRHNQMAMTALCEALQQKMQTALHQGSDKHLAAAQKQGKLTARERIELLLDMDSPFLELMPLAGCERTDINVGGTLIGGIGVVSGKMCLVTANVGTIKGGSVDYTTLQKGFRFNAIAAENRLPVVTLVESAGANLPEQAKIFNFGGANFRDITRRSRAGLPTISVVFGNSTAGGAYTPGMSDYSIFVKNNAKVFLAGPPLVRMATNEITDDESLGGATMHATVSGVADYLAEDEHDGIRLAREIMATLPNHHPFAPSETAKPPLYPAEDLLGIVSADVKHPFEVREVIARIVDGSDFSEFKTNYGKTLVTGFANINGFPVGIIANNGVLFSEAANKGAQFIQLCNQQNRPLLFLQNITGFMVGQKYEEEGIIKHGAKMINAVANSTVPAITVILGASYGAGNYAMCGRAYEPRFLFTYPNSRIAVMGSEQLGGVMELIGRASAAKAGAAYDEAAGSAIKTAFIANVEKESSAYYATSNLWDDGVIDPRETRNYLGFALATIYNNEVSGAEGYGVFRM